MMKEIVRNDALDRVILATDYFDASINRIAAWVIGVRSVQKALLNALLLPNEKMKEMQNKLEFTELMMLQEELKLYPMGDIWNELCARAGMAGDASWFNSVKDYEKDILSNR
jgi:L-rhamnose isomerase